MGYIVTLIAGIFIFIITFVLTRKVKLNEAVILSKNAELMKSNNDKTKIFSIVSHDLRNQIAAMVNISYIFKDHLKSMSSEQLARQIEILYSTTSSISKTLENLLDWSRINLDEIVVNKGKYEILHIIQQSIGDINVNAERKSITISIDGVINTNVYCDGDMVRVVIRNLISNAIKFSPNNSLIALSATEPSADNSIIVSIKDSGSGMSKEKIAELFSDNQIASTKGTEGETGTGLGFRLCREFIEKNGGKI
jgi:K+-sensing histidine kinase KdpD